MNPAIETPARTRPPDPGSDPSRAFYWHIAPAWRDRAAALAAVPWHDLEHWGQATPLKVSPTRSVWRFTLGGRPLVVKIHRPRTAWERIKSVLQGPAGQHEYDAAVHAAHRGLDVIRPVACALASAGPDHLFISEALLDAETLSSSWRRATVRGDRPRRQALSAATARLLGTLHAGDFLPRDLHPENILVRDEDGHCRATLVDLHHARWGRTPLLDARQANFADLCQWFQYHASRADMLRFFRSYAAAADLPIRHPELRHSAARVARLTARRGAALARKRDRRIYGDNAYVGRVQLDEGWLAFVLLRGPRAGNGSPLDQRTVSKSEWAAALPALLSRVAGQRPGPLPGSLRLGSVDVPVILQHATRRPGRLRGQWEQAHRELNRLQPGTRPLALLEREGGRATSESLLILEGASP